MTETEHRRHVADAPTVDELRQAATAASRVANDPSARGEAGSAHAQAASRLDNLANAIVDGDASIALTTARVHTFATDSEAYDASQTDDAIADGDVLLIADTGQAAVLVEAWPTIVAGNIGCFHGIADADSWERFRGGRYAVSAERARLALLRHAADELRRLPGVISHGTAELQRLRRALDATA